MLALVSEIRRAIQNGRQIEKLLSRTGPDLINQPGSLGKFVPGLPI